MIATTSNAIRQKFIVDTMASLSSDDMYLCFSFDDPSATLDGDIANAPIESIHDGVDISLVYAVKLDSILKYATPTSVYTGSDIITVNNTQYSIESSLTGLEDYYFTNLYFNAVLDPAASFTYNIVSVVIGLTGITGDEVTDFSTVDITGATIVVQSRHANSTVDTATEFPGLLVF